MSNHVSLAEIGEFSPSFVRMSPAVIEHAVHYGAALVNSFLSDDSVNRLRNDGVCSIPSVMALRAPELQSMYDILGITDDSPGFRAGLLETPAAGTGVHTDNGVHDGLSFLMPTRGIKKAIFGADEQLFSIATDIPKFVVEYGIGDLVIVRQSLKTVNGKEVKYKKMHHFGKSGQEREIACIDWRNADIEFAVAA